MFKLNFKIAFRNLWKNRGITAINVGGLAIALAAFILVALYVQFETTFDHDVKNYDRIYLVGRSSSTFKTNYTPPPLTKLISDNFPEVASVGKMKGGFFEFPLNTDHGRFYSSKSVQMDYELAKMFNVIPYGSLQKPEDKDMYLPKNAMLELFPGDESNEPKQVIMGPKEGGAIRIVKGVVDGDRSHSNIQFDLLVIGNDLGKDEDYGYNNYNTYVQLKEGADPSLFAQKLNNLYRTELAKGDENPDMAYINSVQVFLDPLKQLHLRSTAGNDAGFKIVVAISALGLLILLIACINFTNLSIVQATRRAKEVGVKKVMGAYRFQLTLQFLTEIFMQCAFATVFGLILAELVLPKFNTMFHVNLQIWTNHSALIWQLPLLLVLITFIAGAYPAMVLSGFKPATVLKGNFQTSKQSHLLRNGLLVAQFSIAVIFITGLMIINSQLNYMRTQDVGFNPEQVVSIKNMAIFSDPAKFAPVRERILKVDGVSSVTASNAIPDGSKMGSNRYTIDGNDQTISFVDVDFDYFETLGIKVAAGRTFSPTFKTDTSSAAILNETAVAKFNLKNPIGKTIRGCNIAYTIVGVVKDFKSQGFEKTVEPTIYTINNPCGNLKTSLMIKAQASKMASVLSTLKSEWSQINKLDGEDFRYDFLDQLYGKLFEKQEQLQSIFFAATVLTIFIALLGLFAFAKYVTSGRTKEIAVRKVLGATDFQLFKLLNTSFFSLVLLANLLSLPIAFVLTKKWLETFAYRIEMPILPYFLSILITLVLTVITVSLQARNAVKLNPVNALKYE